MTVLNWIGEHPVLTCIILVIFWGGLYDCILAWRKNKE